MSVWHIVGVDPGLVHTGVVRLYIGEGSVLHSHALVPGPDAIMTRRWINSVAKPDLIAIEKYEPRFHFSSDGRMVRAEAEFKRQMKSAKVISNSGVKKVVGDPMLALMGLLNFSTPSHHQDLRAAARIAVLGMLKNSEMNTTVADLVRDAVDGRPWSTTDLGGEVLDAYDAGAVGIA